MSRRKCCPTCIACQDGAHPGELTVTISGVSSGCAGCADLNGSWTLTLLSVTLGMVTCDGVCAATYVGTFDDVAGCDGTLSLELYIAYNGWYEPGSCSYGDRRRSIIMRITLGGAYFNADLLESDSEPYDCSHFSDYPVPLYSTNGACVVAPGSNILISV